MTWTTGIADLVELLDRQFAFLDAQHEHRVLYALPRVIRLIESEPRLKAIVDEFTAEVASSLESFARHEQCVMGQLRGIWHQHGSELEEADREKDFPYSGQRVRAMVADDPSPPMIAFPHDREPKSDPGHCSRPLLGTRHLCQCLLDRCEPESQTEWLLRLSMLLGNLEEQHLHAVRQFLLDGRNLPGVAYQRLAWLARNVNPVPVPFDGSDSAALSDATAARGAELSDALFSPNWRPDLIRKTVIPQVLRAKRDASLVHEELRARIGLARSRSALVFRFADRCQQFDADRLRKLADESGGRPERVLTLELARYLFDHGLSPLVDPELMGLRPDLFQPDQRWTLYVEAKQYDGSATKQGLTRYCGQVWSTWGRLRNRYEVREAFLVVFRRAGPLFHLPKMVRHDGLVLYPVLVDIAASSEAGSREKSLPIDVADIDLLPSRVE